MEHGQIYWLQAAGVFCCRVVAQLSQGRPWIVTGVLYGELVLERTVNLALNHEVVYRAYASCLGTISTTTDPVANEPATENPNC